MIKKYLSAAREAAFFVQRRQYGTKNKQGNPGIPGGDVLGADHRHNGRYFIRTQSADQIHAGIGVNVCIW